MKILITILSIILVFLIYNHIQISKIYINEPILENPKLSSEIRITQISDYHNNYRIDQDKLLTSIEDFNPHIIALTGDIIDSETKDICDTMELIEKLMEINPNIFFVRGNHEIASLYEGDFIYRLKELGITILDNENTVLNIEGEKLNICGVGFYIDEEDYARAIEGIDKKNFTILLSHSPNRPVSFSEGIEDLILSGHTHGGQVRIPIIGALLAPGQEPFPKYSKGIYKLENSILYIDSGLGNSVLPLRLFNRVQISNIKISN